MKYLSKTVSLVLTQMLLLLLAGTGLTAQATTTYAKTRYPIVLVHGMSGFDTILGVDYFYRVPDELRANGAVVLVAEVSQFNDNTVRGEQLLKQMQQWAENTEAFNAQFPDGRPTSYCGAGPERSIKTGIYYYSATGNKAKTNGWDVSDLAMMEVEGVPSDGLVPVCSTHWGKVLRDDYPWNHFDEMNHVFGLIGKGAPDPVSFYRTHANRLKLKWI